MTRGKSPSPSVPIVLSEEGGIRYLHFGSPWIQGAMLVRAPAVIVIDYVARMMGWLMFLDPPRRILQLGLGAGALTRFTLANLHGSTVTAVECSTEVIDTARQWFALPREGPRLRIVHADAGEFLARNAGSGNQYGVIQVDLYDMHARGPVLDSVPFYRDCRAALAPAGVCVVNLFGRHASYARNLARIGRAFEGRVLALPPTPAGNVVAFAFSGPPLAVGWRELRARASTLRNRYGLDAPAWVRALRAERSGEWLSV